MANSAFCSLWQPYKDLYNVIERAVYKCEEGILPDLETVFRSNYPIFLSFLKNPPRSQNERELIKRAVEEGINLPGTSVTQSLPQHLVEESLLLSNMFNMSELSALELLLTGESQIPNFPFVPRGLIAILLYYDGRKSLVWSLKMLLQARQGHTWTLGLSDEITAAITKFTNQIIDEGLLEKILTTIEGMDIDEEIQILQKNRALGPMWHRRQVNDLLLGIKCGLGEAVFCWAAQSSMETSQMIRLISYLCKINPNNSSTGCLEATNLALVLAAMFALDVSKLLESDGFEEGFFILSDPDYIPHIHRELKNASKTWRDPGLLSLLQLTWAVTLRQLSQLPNPPDSHLLEEDEYLFDLALENRVFQCLSSLIMKSPVLKKEEYYLRRLHQLFTDIIMYFPLRMKDLRNKADESSRIIVAHQQEGIEPPSNLPQHFQQFLSCLHELYTDNPLDLNLCLEYWCPNDSSITSYHLPHRQVALSKFVRLAGDLLPPTLYVPYIKMVRSIADSPKTAHFCFNLLKSNSAGQCTSVSWDHFFGTLQRYYQSLRHELPAGEVIYRHSGIKGITPQEVEGLKAVLQLTQTVAKHDVGSRIALYEHPVWLPVVVCFGLVGCSIPAELKACFLTCLAAFAKSPELSSSIWQTMEGAQLLQTTSSTSSYQQSGIKVELEEIEARNEEFPLTLGFLSLISALVDHPIPRGLGIGHRPPGIDPYLEFVRDSVFLKFNTRAYRNVEEKWEVCQRCLEIFLKLLKAYSPQSEDFGEVIVDGGGSQVFANKPPGFVLMVHLLHDSQLLKMLLFILDEGSHLLDNYPSLSRVEACEASCHLALELLNHVLSEQQKFMMLLRNSGSALLLISLDKLLLCSNPRSGKPDHLLNIAKFMSLGTVPYEHAVVVLKILKVMAQSPTSHHHLVTTLTDTRQIQSLMLHAFVDCLESDAASEEVKVLILELMLVSLNMPNVNLAQFLVGFSIDKPVSQQTLQEPGFCDAPKTCLNTILHILSNGQCDRVSELAMKLIYCLCHHSDTSEPVMRYLRSSKDFFYKNLASSPISLENVASSLNMMAWLMKAVAIELKAVSATRQQSYLVRLLQLLVENAQNDTFGQQENRKLIKMLRILEFKMEPVTSPAWNYFEPSQVAGAIKSCEHECEFSIKYISIPKLQNLLTQELESLQGSAALGQRHLIHEEIMEILKYATLLNSQVELGAAKFQYLDGWRQMTEIFLTACPTDIFSAPVRQQLILDVTQELVNKLLHDEVLPDLVKLGAGVVLILLTALRLFLLTFGADSNESCYVSMLDEFGNQSSGVKFTASHQMVLQGILDCIIKTKRSQQRVRVYFYGALLHYLRIGTHKTSPAQFEDGEFERHRKENLDVIMSFGEPLMDIVCKDSCGGHDIARMEALSCLDLLVSLDRYEGKWIDYLVNKGYLLHIIDSLMSDDELLISELTPQPYPIRTIERFDSKMAFLCRLATLSKGAKALLQCGIFNKLSRMQVFEARPDIINKQINILSEALEEDSVIPSVNQRYRQILSSALHICLSVLQSLGGNNASAVHQVFHFILSHSEIFVNILRCTPNNLSLSQMKEVVNLTGIMSIVAHDDGINISDPAGLELQGRISRFQRHIISMFPVFFISEKRMKSWEASENQQYRIAFIQVMANIFAHARNIIHRSATNSKYMRILFDPSLMEAMSREIFGVEDPQAVSYLPSRPPGIGLLICHIKQISIYFNKVLKTFSDMKHKLKVFDTLTLEQIQRFLPNSERKDVLSSHDQKSLARSHLETMISQYNVECKLLAFCLESVMFLLWRHLEFYLVHCLGTDHCGTRYQNVMRRVNEPTLNGDVYNQSIDAAVGVSPEDIENLKKDVTKCFSDQLFTRLRDLGKEYFSKTAHVEFFSALIRRIQRLILLHTAS